MGKTYKDQKKFYEKQENLNGPVKIKQSPKGRNKKTKQQIIEEMMDKGNLGI